MPISARHDDPVLETLARGVYALFPRCVRCGAIVETFEAADVQILKHRVVHRGGCPSREDELRDDGGASPDPRHG